MRFLGSFASVLVVVFMSACTDDPKVDRAAVSKGTPKAQGADNDKLGANDASGKRTTQGAEKLDKPENEGRDKNEDSSSGRNSGSQEKVVLPTIEEENSKWKRFCEDGNSVACMRYAANLNLIDKATEAGEMYILACTKKKEIPSGPCKDLGDPIQVDARGCYNAGVFALRGGDKGRAKSLLTCACDMKFTQACLDAKLL